MLVEEDLELEEQLRFLNKPAVTTIQTKSGDTYNCVNYYEQPAFDHPALKNEKYKYQMRLSNNKGKKEKNTIWLNGYGCPVGTVPIKPITKDDLIRAKSASNMYDSKVRPQDESYPGLHTQRGSCYNTLCPAPAFILETSEIPLDYAFPQISQRGGDIYSTGFFVYKDKANGDWYLQVGTKGVGIGRWPQKMFGALADSASYIEWGGQVITPPNVPSPEMGSGHQLPLSLDERYDAVCNQIRLIDENNNEVNPEDTETLRDIVTVYDVVDLGRRGQEGRVIVYGGNGGYTGN
ncbi:hypothetical protein Tsubulata_012370 [Turnera subulata]|uniref:Neprosin PEP catalytic domain-containing protein n=1 Tax=Turnera subulata TaxID=218843 RepID=A0A9Q0FV67_9ROSI|nr:hypothetical protein Tsubulata_012370 [Turnera subulata]